jgi:hypothetical protein
VLSRYLVDSAAVGRMLKIAAAIDRERDVSRSTETAGAIVEALLASGVDAAARLLAVAAAVPVEAAQSILADTGGEPLTIVLKAAGMSRKEFAASLDRLKAAGAVQLPPDRDVAELQRLYDSLSYNKAKVLLTYWSWGIGKSSVYFSQI